MIACTHQHHHQHEHQDQDQNLSKVPCQICYSWFPSNPLSSLRPHGICYQCWYRHIKQKTTQITYKAGSDIISPFQGSPNIDIGQVMHSLKTQQRIQLQQSLFKKYSSFTVDIQKCPSSACDYVFTMQKCKWPVLNTQKCPKCDATLGQTQTISLKSIMGFLYFLFLTSKCPKCDIPIQKTIGCPHMSCPCGHNFCWFCLKDYYPANNNLYSVHQAKQCAAILIFKTMFTIICIGGVFLTLLGGQVFHQLVNLTFLVLKYALQTILLDLFIAINVVMINHIAPKLFNKHHHHYSPQNIGWIIFGLVLVDIIIISGGYYFELLWASVVILLVESGVLLVSAGIIWCVIYSVETWFEFIC